MQFNKVIMVACMVPSPIDECSKTLQMASISLSPPLRLENGLGYLKRGVAISLGLCGGFPDAALCPIIRSMTVIRDSSQQFKSVN